MVKEKPKQKGSSHHGKVNSLDICVNMSNSFNVAVHKHLLANKESFCPDLPGPKENIDSCL